MKSKRAGKAAVVDPEPKTKGTIWAEENRARCNKLTDAQREKLQARAWEIIYGRKAAVRRRWHERLLDLANKAEPVIDALATLRRRVKGVRIVVTPTVLHELANLVDHGVTAEIQAAALRAGERLHRVWRFEPMNFSALEHGIAERIASRLLGRGLLPEEEVHDALILAEAALQGCSILLTSDKHLREMDYRAAALELKACDVEMPVIATPREIVFKFF